MQIYDWKGEIQEKKNQIKSNIWEKDCDITLTLLIIQNWDKK